MIGKKYFDSTNLMHLAMVISLLRPDLQGFVGQNTTPPMPIYNFHPQNFTGVSFPPSSTSNIDLHLAAKEAAADSSNPLSEFLDWHTSSHNQFNSDSVAMLFDGVSHTPREQRDSFSTELESGYSSDGGRSPSALSSASSSPPHDTSAGTGTTFHNFQDTESDLSVLGAAGYTPPPDDLIDLKSLDFELEDFIDVDSILYDPSEHIFTPETESNSSHGTTFGRKVPSSPQDFQVPSGSPQKNPLEDLSLHDPFPGLEDQFYDPFSIDFPAASEGVQGHATSVDSVFDFDSLPDNVDFILPLDVYNPSRPSPVDEKLGGFLDTEQYCPTQLSEAVDTRNDSSFPLPCSTQIDLEDASLQDPFIPYISGVVIKQENTEASPLSSPPACKSYRDSAASTPSSLTASKACKETRNTLTSVTKETDDARPRKLSPYDSGLPVSEEEIVEMSIADFNSFLESLCHNDAQTAKDIRRRGKNKVAARLCRKRKIDVVCDIDEDIQKLRKQKKAMLEERQKLEAENAFFKGKISELQQRLFKSLRDEHGQPLSPKEYSLFQGSNGSTYVGKNLDSEAQKKGKRSV